MNRNFKDTKYYLRRAAETARAGVAEELKPVRERVSRLRGEDEEAESEGRITKVQSRATSGAQRAKGELETVVSRGRERAKSVRGGSAE
jgi:hypothetical protein